MSFSPFLLGTFQAHIRPTVFILDVSATACQGTLWMRRDKVRDVEVDLWRFEVSSA